MPPLVVDVITNHRAALLARESAAMQAQARAWLQVEQALQAQVDALAYELANTATPSMGQLQRSRRYRALMEQTRDELRKYEDYLEPRIRSGQADMITAAMEHSRQAVNAVATEAQMVVQFDRLPVSAVNDMVGLAGDGSPLRAILNDAARVGPDRMAQELVNGIALGRNPIQVARTAMRLGLGQSFTRMQAIARTEQLRVYRQVSLESYQNSRIVIGYKRLSARDDRTCIACLAADGRFYRVDEGFDEHVQGRCSLIPVLANVPPVVYEDGQTWFNRQPESVQREMLGRGRYDIWRRGDASLDDMVTRIDNPTWGGSLVPTPVRDLG
jgi:SPP1 gp7 family putative phage head morphogenesis protein